MIASTWRNLWCLSAGKKSTLSFTFSLRYSKDLQTSYFGYFGHAWLSTRNLIVSTSGKFWCFACQKWTSTFSSFLRYYFLKNPTIWLANSILSHKLRTRIFPDMVLVMKYQKQYKFSRHRTDKNDVTPTDNAKKKQQLQLLATL